MKQVDLLGIPGIGKSTVMKALEKNHSSKSGYLFPRAAKRLAAHKAFSGSPSYQERLAASLLCSAPFYRPIGRLLIARKGFQKKALYSYAENHSPFLENCAKGLAGKSQDPAHMLLGATWLTKKIEEYYFLERYLDQKSRVIFDESLLQKVFGTWDVTALDPEGIKNFFYHVPQPSGAIIIEGPANLTAKRIKQRAKVITAHRNLETKELIAWVEKAGTIIDLARKTLAERKVKILLLSAASTAEDNAREIDNFMTTLT